MDGSFEEAYYYTTASGCEFLITADGDTVWADCTTAKTSVSLYGAYLTTADIEQIAEQSGFNSASHFSRVFRSREKMTPSKFRSMNF